MSLTTLSILPLERIASYLNFSSLVNLAATTSSLAHLQPKEQLVIGEEFSVPGLCSRSWRSDSDSDTESATVTDPNFDVEVKTQGLLGIKRVWECKGKVIIKIEIHRSLDLSIFFKVGQAWMLGYGEGKVYEGSVVAAACQRGQGGGSAGALGL